jgi:hypothetical protein
MTNGKFRVSFEVSDNWTILGFRNFIKVLLSDTDKFEVFIISNDDSTSYINNIGESLNIDSSHIKICNFTDDKIQKVEENNIDIHLDNLQSFTILLEPTNTRGILVTKTLNKFYLQPDYIIVFDRIMQEILNDSN